MFSTRYKAFDGLEKDDKEELMSIAEDIQKSNKYREMKKKRDRPHDREDEKHDRAMRELLEAFEKLEKRPFCGVDETTSIPTAKEFDVRSDPQARYALRRLYDHLKLHKNPASMDHDKWFAELKERSETFISFLPIPPTPILDPEHTWEPRVREKLAFEDMDYWRKNEPRFSPAPLLGEVPVHGNETTEDETAGTKDWETHEGYDSRAIASKVTEVLQQDESVMLK